MNVIAHRIVARNGSVEAACIGLTDEEGGAQPLRSPLALQERQSQGVPDQPEDRHSPLADGRRTGRGRGGARGGSEVALRPPSGGCFKGD